MDIMSQKKRKSLVDSEVKSKKKKNEKKKLVESSDSESSSENEDSPQLVSGFYILLDLSKH